MSNLILKSYSWKSHQNYWWLSKCFFFSSDAILYFPITFKCLESKKQQQGNSKEVPHSFTECLLTTTEGREGAEKTDSGIKFRPVSITVVTGLTSSERWKGNAWTTWGRRLWYTWEERVYVFGLREHGELSLKEKKQCDSAACQAF